MYASSAAYLRFCAYCIERRRYGKSRRLSVGVSLTAISYVLVQTPTNLSSAFLHTSRLGNVVVADQALLDAFTCMPVYLRLARIVPLFLVGSVQLKSNRIMGKMSGR